MTAYSPYWCPDEASEVLALQPIGGDLVAYLTLAGIDNPLAHGSYDCAEPSAGVSEVGSKMRVPA